MIKKRWSASYITALLLIILPFWLARKISSKAKSSTYSLRDKDDALTFIAINLIYKESDNSDSKELEEAVVMLHGIIGDKVKNSSLKVQRFMLNSLNKGHDTFDVLFKAVEKVNKGWSLDEKQRIIDGLLDIAFADGKVTGYEALLLSYYEKNLGVRIKDANYQSYIKELENSEKKLM
jgi:hypothetical protein